VLEARKFNNDVPGAALAFDGVGFAAAGREIRAEAFQTLALPSLHKPDSHPDPVRPPVQPNIPWPLFSPRLV
jgi:hypothetical protein